ncbi:MAG TPA: MBL fold metallo-hydrolase [Dehalococcoidia bacterium]|nr:MBL fold metallo-hydrolase [Dehalococcoidia bacterium]
MASDRRPLDLLFLGSGNAFAAEGRAFSSFLLDGRHLFDCGPTLLQQLQKAGVSSHEIETVFISHFHADHFFGLPFLLLDGKYGGRTSELTIVGPEGIEERTRRLLELGYPTLLGEQPFLTRFVEVRDGSEGSVGGMAFAAVRVEHVPTMQCFAYRVELGGRSLVYSGDTTLCQSLLDLAGSADVVVLECSCERVPVHLGPEGVAEVARRAAGATLIVTHLDGKPHPQDFDGLLVASDLSRFRV